MTFFGDRPADRAPARPVMRFLLRREGRDVMLPKGPITVGRSSVCDVVIDDPRVSAEHARLVATTDGVTVTDLDSLNGVFVNGVRVTGEMSLVAGDLAAFGEVVFEVVAKEVQDADLHESDRPTLMDVVSPFAEDPVERSQDIEGFRVLASVIDKAIALDHVDNVEPVAADCLNRIAEDTEAGKVVEQELLELAARYTVKLAAATGRGVWVNTLLRIYHGRAEILPVDLIDALYGILRRTRGVDWKLLGDYVVLLRTLTSRMTPAERFASNRIEGLLGFGPG
jgi:hypothetical protein